MAPSLTSYLFLHSLLLTLLLNLLFARLAVSTLMNPTLVRSFACRPPTTPNKPTALSCVAAMLAFPSSNPDVDYRILPTASGPMPRVVYNTALTSVGDPSSPYHLPRTSDFGDCRVTVSMAEGVQFARVLWLDVQQYTMALITECVSDATVLPPRPGPGAGGSTSIGAVTITVEAVAPPALAGKPAAGTLNKDEPGEGDRRQSSFRIGAHYPPGMGASKIDV